MLRDILRKDPEPMAVAKQIADAAPDIIVLQNIDFDSQNHGLSGLRELINNQGGPSYPHLFAPRPNTGIPTGIDIDGDGISNGPRDAHGYGTFPGQRGIAILSQHPIATAGVQSFSNILWQNAAAAAPDVIPAPEMLSIDARDTFRLSSTAHVAIPFSINGSLLTILTHHATPPMFDGPEDRNGFRNAAENLFWLAYLNGTFTEALPQSYILAALTNIDPNKGQGHRSAMQSILQSQQFREPLVTVPPTNRVTVQWNETQSSSMRVSYLLPSPNITVKATGNRPMPSASRHHLIWIDIDF
ncbi:endonuclease/exonuclease/phosphatase family protein [Cognatishimia sp. 1_MG-2023]|uniref:endonuclease/exonuclease/phosphatase family protein n=1 Tax=Cognatishimia sp. 1_MG-2023 TaxID=3062642 RepID=UPI0026E2DC46|nr:endonuclease/exonuclease/phosphatase family protein [Cognatishimia sp. 1_MG-2023]MDO6727979.1 endonuclease/exonuclease/phosphatase family protein [Cognatishimia sp. 1_MG-2023]